jgi:hypothetical protein
MTPGHGITIDYTIRDGEANDALHSISNGG